MDAEFAPDLDAITLLTSLRFQFVPFQLRCRLVVPNRHRFVRVADDAGDSAGHIRRLGISLQLVSEQVQLRVKRVVPETRSEAEVN
jgi:hypothetical protein